jgi:ribonuclease HII
MDDLWAYEKDARCRGYLRIAGVDEAGRGPLAGPVVAAAVILPPDFDLTGITDSKKLTPARREAAFERITSQAQYGTGVISHEIIDTINILKATHLAMKTALEELGALYDIILVDGLPVPGLPGESLAIIKGDSKSASIAAASIIAKVTRDRIMVEIDSAYPAYGFAGHKGYYCKTHIDALDTHGPCPCHRKSFAPVAERMPDCRLPGLG